MQRLWLLQVRQVRLHAHRETLLRCGPHRGRGRPQKGDKKIRLIYVSYEVKILFHALSMKEPREYEEKL